MVKLKRVDEGQLDLFSWKPKNDAPIIPTSASKPKVTSTVEKPNNQSNSSDVEDNAYNGREDTDQSKWYTPGFLNRKYREFNARFFNNDLPDNLPVKVASSRGGKTAGGCHFMMNTRTSEITPVEIRILNKKFANRYILENVLLHEMCHVYQANFFM